LFSSFLKTKTYFCLKIIKTKFLTKRIAMKNEQELAVFEKKHIRSLNHEAEVWFSVVDIIAVLTDAAQPKAYWSQIKKREPQVLPILQQLKLPAADGKFYKTDCANTEGVLRIIQSVPSPKAEPFKMWLASLGKQAIDEEVNPELGFERIREIYRAQGRTDEWIQHRLQTIETRKELTEEWKKRGINEGQEYSHLTATIAKGTFGHTPSEHAKLKGLDKQNLRDHMTRFELIFTALGEEATRTLTVDRDAQGFTDNYDAANDGGKMAGNARRNFEKELGKSVVSNQNFLNVETDKKELPDTD
jgi:DNA-damage-inducible protein D